MGAAVIPAIITGILSAGGQAYAAKQADKRAKQASSAADAAQKQLEAEQKALDIQAANKILRARKKPTGNKPRDTILTGTQLGTTQTGIQTGKTLLGA